jgi:glycosyltransferase involved in cell wall biosynthesis
MEDDRRRVLVLAYFFPPVGGAGVQRTLKFVKYLAQLGWDATVVAPRSRAYRIRDSSLLADVPPTTRVRRTASLPLARYVGYGLHRLGLVRLSAYVVWPDGGIGWSPFALLTTLRAVRRDRPDVVFSTSAPFGSHLVALLVARITGLPWVADFRDEWATNPHLADQPRVLAELTARVERAITARADRVVVAADYFELAGLPRTDPKRVEIVNGVDDEDLAHNSPAAPPSDRFVLAHVGTLYDIRDPSPALRALAALIRRGVVDGDRFEVRLVGNVWLSGFLPPPEIRLTTTGYVDHANAIAEMRAATALLLYVPGASLAPSGKLFEYLASGRPVLSLARSDNAASRLVETWNAGVVADPHDEEAIGQAILALWERWADDALPDQQAVRAKTLEHFSRRTAARKLAQVLDEACNA